MKKLVLSLLILVAGVVKAQPAKTIVVITAKASRSVTARSVTVKPTRPNVMASLKIENESAQYKVFYNQSDKETLLERVSSKLSNKTIKIPKGLAIAIKSDLLNLSWQAQYKSSRNTASSCTIAARIEIEAEDGIKICADQKSELAKLRQIQKNLNDLIESRK